MADRPFQPEHVKVEYDDHYSVATFTLCGRGREPLAVITCFMPATADNVEQLDAWEGRVRAHLEFCWSISANNAKAAVDVFAATLDQIAGRKQIPEPILVDGQVPHLFLPDID